MGTIVLPLPLPLPLPPSIAPSPLHNVLNVAPASPHRVAKLAHCGRLAVPSLSLRHSWLSTGRGLGQPPCPAMHCSHPVMCVLWTLHGKTRREEQHMTCTCKCGGWAEAKRKGVTPHSTTGPHGSSPLQQRAWESVAGHGDASMHACEAHPPAGLDNCRHSLAAEHAHAAHRRRCKERKHRGRGRSATGLRHICVCQINMCSRLRLPANVHRHPPATPTCDALLYYAAGTAAQRHPALAAWHGWASQADAAQHAEGLAVAAAGCSR
jgi:hypothetical protein